MNPHLCHLSRDARGLERSHRFLSRGRAVKVHEAISCGEGGGGGGGVERQMGGCRQFILQPASKNKKQKKKPRRVAVTNSDADPTHPAF